MGDIGKFKKVSPYTSHLVQPGAGRKYVSPKNKMSVTGGAPKMFFFY